MNAFKFMERLDMSEESKVTKAELLEQMADNDYDDNAAEPEHTNQNYLYINHRKKKGSKRCH